MMKAVIAQDKQPVIVELPIPQPQEGELLVRVATTALNRADLLQVAGNYPHRQDRQTRSA
jgi:NADPH:quinone reductase-like Zn-dependent oxidoreductase